VTNKDKMTRVLLLSVCLLAVAYAGSVEMNPSNFDSLVLNSGKNAFIKFQAPW